MTDGDARAKLPEQLVGRDAKSAESHADSRAPFPERRRDHDTEEEAARAFDRAAINKAAPPRRPITRCPITSARWTRSRTSPRANSSRRFAPRRAPRDADQSVSRRVPFEADGQVARTDKRRGKTTPPRFLQHGGARGARTYDRAAGCKAGAEGGVVVTNLDISLYADEIELHSMSREEPHGDDRRGQEMRERGEREDRRRRKAGRLRREPRRDSRSAPRRPPERRWERKPPRRKKGARGPEDRVRTSFASVPVRWRARWRRRATPRDAPRLPEQLVGRDAPRRTRQGRLTPERGPRG